MQGGYDGTTWLNDMYEFDYTGDGAWSQTVVHGHVRLFHLHFRVYSHYFDCVVSAAIWKIVSIVGHAR